MTPKKCEECKGVLACFGLPEGKNKKRTESGTTRNPQAVL